MANGADEISHNPVVPAADSPLSENTNSMSSGHNKHFNSSTGTRNNDTTSGGGGGGISASTAEKLNNLLYPSDSYTDDKSYWADLPRGQRSRWINHQNNAEAKRELKEIWTIFKRDPLEPLSIYYNNYIVTGLGLFVEGYVLFSIGNLKPLFSSVWPECWSRHEVCDKNWIAAIDYLQIIGIIFGQIVVGVECDWIGRRVGLVQDALVMFVGSLMLASSWGAGSNYLQGWVICYAWSQFIYGFGVGGEYPVVGTTSMEKAAGKGASNQDRMHRGRRVALSFLQQGWGQLFNQGLLIILLLIFNHNLGPNISATAAQYTYRVSFGIIAFFTLYLAYIRFYKIKTSDHALKAAKKRLNTSGYDMKSLKMAGGHYWGRMIGTAGCWLCNDFAFYGSKIFSGVFIQIITGQSNNIQTTWLYNLINVGVSLVGYYMGALLVDHKSYGRKWMQANGFMMLFILLLISAAAYPVLTVPGTGLQAFQAIFFLLSFFNQFGPNTTTFILAAESYPASIRASAHGVSAASGKVGALIPAVLYNYIDNRTKFWVVTWFALTGWLLTLVFVADTAGLDLRELERYWKYVTEGREKEYHGVAIHPRHLSLFERVVLKRHLAYDADLDHQAKIKELEDVYESTKELNGVEDESMSEEQREFLENELSGFFESEKKLHGHSVPRHQKNRSELANLEKKLWN